MGSLIVKGMNEGVRDSQITNLPLGEEDTNDEGDRDEDTEEGVIVDTQSLGKTRPTVERTVSTQ